MTEKPELLIVVIDRVDGFLKQFSIELIDPEVGIIDVDVSDWVNRVLIAVRNHFEIEDIMLNFPRNRVILQRIPPVERYMVLVEDASHLDQSPGLVLSLTHLCKMPGFTFKMVVVGAARAVFNLVGLVS